MNEGFVYADGKQVCFLFKEESSGREMAYIMKKPHIVSIDVNQPYDIDQINLLGDKAIIPMVPAPIDIQINWKVMPENLIMESSEKGGLIKSITLDMFDGISVSQMFRIINKKISKRTKG